MDFPELAESDFQAIRTLMARISGITMASHKRQLVAGRLMKRLRALSFNSFSEYVAFLVAPMNEEERRLAVDLLTTNETFFFREEGHFRLLEKWLQSYSGTSLKIWSAACSSGEEVYSLAMVLQEARLPCPWQLSGSDLCRHALNSATQGIYPMSRCTGIPDEYLKRYCLKGVGEMEGYLQITPLLRNQVSFHCINLNEPLPADMTSFDVIFLRNMLIYFDMDAKQSILERICSRLKMGGLLFIGHSDSINGLSLPLTALGSAVYRRSS